MRYCNGCYEKQLEIDRLKKRIEHLENEINYSKRKEKEGYFGSSTPSAKKPFKKNSSKDKQNKNCGDHKRKRRQVQSSTNRTVLFPLFETLSG